MKIFQTLILFICLAFGQINALDSNIVKKAIIFGVTGQDGSYLAEFLLDKNYEVHGVKRQSSTSNTSRIDQFCHEILLSDDRFYLHFGDVADTGNIIDLIQKIQPNEIYNLAAQSHVRVSFDLPEYTGNINALGPLRILEAIRLLGLEKKVKFCQASTSEMFGATNESPQKETTPFYPRSPYGVSKLFGHWITVNYREAYGIFSCSAILFNHESPLRGESFVTRKVTLAACRYKLGMQDVLYLGNLDSRRDWGYAKDYVEAMWLMLQQDKPGDYVIATGEMHTIRELVELAYKVLDINIEWQGDGINEVGIDQATGNVIIKIDPRFFRPCEVDLTIGQPVKAYRILNWKPQTQFKDLIKIMVQEDYKTLLKEIYRK